MNESVRQDCMSRPWGHLWNTMGRLSACWNKQSFQTSVQHLHTWTTPDWHTMTAYCQHPSWHQYPNPSEQRSCTSWLVIDIDHRVRHVGWWWSQIECEQPCVLRHIEGWTSQVECMDHTRNMGSLSIHWWVFVWLYHLHKQNMLCLIGQWTLAVNKMRYTVPECR